MKKLDISDEGLDKEDLEASEQELKGVAYTAISFLASLIVLAGTMIYLLS